MRIGNEKAASGEFSQLAVTDLPTVSRVENLWSWTEITGVPLSWAIAMCSILLPGL
jgi:hypothetical protein